MKQRLSGLPGDSERSTGGGLLRDEQTQWSGSAPAQVIRDPTDSPGAQETRARLERFRAIHDLLDDHQDEWTKAYPDLWVAVTAAGIVASAETQDALLAAVGHEQIRSGDMITEVLLTNPPHLAL